eukprot:3081752-Pyramimonas_sp.AAC.2
MHFWDRAQQSTILSARLIDVPYRCWYARAGSEGSGCGRACCPGGVGVQGAGYPWSAWPSDIGTCCAETGCSLTTG